MARSVHCAAAVVDLSVDHLSTAFLPTTIYGRLACEHNTPFFTVVWRRRHHRGIDTESARALELSPVPEA